MITDDTRKGIECKVFCSKGMEKDEIEAGCSLQDFSAKERLLPYRIGCSAGQSAFAMTVLRADRYLVTSSEFGNIHCLVCPGNQCFHIEGVLVSC